jgi:O-antigen/teichoic acid export membrane protein
VPGLLKKIGHYSIAQVAIMAAGLVSFPILTRILSRAEYGVMGLIVTILNLTIGVSKMGLGSGAVVRLWPEWEARENGKAKFILTVFVTIVIVSIPVLLLTDAVTLAIGPWIGPRLRTFIILASPLIVIRALNAFGLGVLQAREWSKPRALFETATAYAAMILAVLGAAVVIGGLRGYYIGLISGEALVLAVLLLYVLRETRLRRSNLSGQLLREAVTFGFPIVIYELSGVLFYTGDRFLIMWLLDATALGYYTVAFNLANYANVAFGFPVSMAVGPAVTNLYEKEGSEAASEFLRRAARYFLLFALAAVAGMTIVREDLLVLLASEKFRPGARLIHILLAGFLLATTREIVGVGLLLKKKPWMMAGLNLAGACLNAVLNLVLIPLLREMGAAVATLASQLTMTLIFWVLGSRMVRVPIDLGALAKHLLCAGAMGAAIYWVDVGPGPLRMVLRVIGGVLIYGVLVVAIDTDVRRTVGRVIKKRKEKD